MRFIEEECGTGFPEREEGLFNCIVVEVEEKLTRKDDDMWTLKFENTETGGVICYDNLSFGKDAKGIAFTKLKKLGIQKSADGFYECESQDLVGKEVMLDLIFDEYDGKTHLSPDISKDGFGYSPVACKDDPGF